MIAFYFVYRKHPCHLVSKDAFTYIDDKGDLVGKCLGIVLITNHGTERTNKRDCECFMQMPKNIPTFFFSFLSVNPAANKAKYKPLPLLCC